MKRFIKQALIVLLCICTMLFFSGCGISHRDEVISDARYGKFKELTDGGMSKEDANKWLDEHEDEWHPDYKKDASDKKEETEKPTEEPIDFMEAICGTYEMTGQAVVITESETITNDRKFTVVVDDAGDGKISVNAKEGDLEFTEIATLNEGNKTATFKLKNSAYTDCSITFDTSGDTVKAKLHMGADNEDATKWYVDLSGTKS